MATTSWCAKSLPRATINHSPSSNNRYTRFLFCSRSSLWLHFFLRSALAAARPGTWGVINEVWMYACMYVCRFVCIYACMHACLYVYIYIYMCVYMYASAYGEQSTIWVFCAFIVACSSWWGHSLRYTLTPVEQFITALHALVPHRLVAAPVNNYKTRLVQQAASLFAKDCIQGYFVSLWKNVDYSGLALTLL